MDAQSSDAASAGRASGDGRLAAHALPRDADEAVRARFYAHHARLVGYARLLVDDLGTAEDVVQDAFVSLHRHFGSLRDPGAALPYLRAAVANGARSQIRRLRVARTRGSAFVADVPSAESTAVLHEDHREVLAGLAALPLRQRQVLVLRYYLDLTEAEIASTLEISRGSVKAHASRALAALTTRLEAAR